VAESLADLVKLLADEPTVEHRDRFFRALSVSKVAIPLQNPPAGLRHGDTFTVAPQDQITIPETRGPDGARWLLVYCDAAAMQAKNPKSVWAELAGRMVLEVARANGLGIIVQNLVGDQPTWSGVSKDQVVQILRGKLV